MKPLLLVLLVLLASALMLQWWQWSPEAALPAPASAPAAAADGIAPAATTDVDAMALEPPPKEAYASVIERPLFLPERRPPAEEPEELVIEDEPLPELTGVDLTAVVITPAVVSAWVRSSESQGIQRLRLGQDYQGWTVKTIEPARLVLERQGETNELPLRDYSNAPPPIPPTRLPPTRRGANTGASQPGAAGAQAADNAPAQRAGRTPELRQRRRAERQAIESNRDFPRRAPSPQPDAIPTDD